MMDKYYDIFDKTLKETDGDGMIKFKAASLALQQTLLLDMPILMRLNFICNSIGKNKDSNINWEKVNDIIKYGDKYKFNNFPYEYIDSIEKLMETRNVVELASIKELRAPYIIVKCIDCGDDFYLTMNDAIFYKNNKFELPKRCKGCKDIKNGIKKPIKSVSNSPKQVPSFTEEEFKTSAFADALAKANLKLDN